jgi:hypothetical protein
MQTNPLPPGPCTKRLNSISSLPTRAQSSKTRRGKRIKQEGQKGRVNHKMRKLHNDLLIFKHYGIENVFALNMFPATEHIAIGQWIHIPQRGNCLILSKICRPIL